MEVESAEKHKMHGVVGPAVFTGQTLRIPGGKEMDLKYKIKAVPQRKTYTAFVEGLSSCQLSQDLLVAKVLTDIKKRGMLQSEL